MQPELGLQSCTAPCTPEAAAVSWPFGSSPFLLAFLVFPPSFLSVSVSLSFSLSPSLPPFVPSSFLFLLLSFATLHVGLSSLSRDQTRAP